MPRGAGHVRFADSHLHLSDYPDSGAILAYARSTETVLLSCGVGKESSERTLVLWRTHPDLVRAFVGLHPSEVSSASEVGWLRTLLSEASGLGEIGLDPKYSDTWGTGMQNQLFLEQLSAAEALRKPVQVHTRNAEKSCLEGLASYNLPSVLLHWFNGELELGSAEQRGYFVSFGPALLASKKLQRMARSYSPDLILVESDGPIEFASLNGAGGPVTVPSVLSKLAELRRTGFSEMAERTARNSMAFLPSLGKVKPTTDSGMDRKIG